ncbi:MAG: hypothetical protein WD648_04865 [Planctomycetaceae bacterium]
MTTKTHAELHADHMHWRNEIKMWRDDIEEWKKEQAKLFCEMEIALGANAAGLKEHAGSVNRHEASIVHHEHFIAECERSTTSPGNAGAVLAEDHKKEVGKHDGLREAHERIKRYHHRAMAKLAAVLRMLGNGV